MNKKYFVCNLKENELKIDYEEYIQELNNIDSKNIELIVCPQYPYISLMDGKKIKIGAQDVSKYEEGSYTGEVSAKTLKKFNVEYVLIGHYERKENFKESEQDIIKKINNVLNNEMKVIYCIGENIEEYEKDKTLNVLESQIANVFNNIPYDKMENIIISYEPNWMIGNGKEIKKEYIEKIINFISSIILNYYDINIKIIYGGGVNENKINELKNVEKLDGFIVGSAILDTKSVKFLINRQI